MPKALPALLVSHKGYPSRTVRRRGVLEFQQDAEIDPRNAPQKSRRA